MKTLYMACEELVYMEKLSAKEDELGRELDDREHYELYMNITPEEVAKKWESTRLWAELNK